MKKILSISILSLLTLSMGAQEKMLNIYPENHGELIRQNIQGHARRMPSETMMTKLAEIQETAEAEAPARVAAAGPSEAGYLPPVGTFFTGVRRNGKACTKGVIGAWAHDMDCWVWPNQTTNYSEISYQTVFNYQYPQYFQNESYAVDAQGNFCDSIVSKGGYEYSMDADGEDGYLWQMATPVQTVVYSDNSTKKFAIYQNTSFPSAQNCALAVGGLPSADADGLWPLTYAIQGNTAAMKEAGEYMYGTSGNASDYCTGFGVEYEAPQRRLYIESISVSLSCDGYNSFASGKAKLHYSPLTARVLDMNGNVIAESSTTVTSNNSVPKYNQLCTFTFESKNAFGEVLSKGFSVEDAFRVEVTGLQPGDTAACYYSEDPLALHGNTSYAIFNRAGSEVRVPRYNMQPYLMLNGIMTTLNDYYVQGGNEEIAYRGDTVDVAFFTSAGLQYNYVCGFANTTYQGQSQFAFYSTFKPYDQETRYWQMDIERPDYILMSADYEYVMQEADDPADNVTLWNYYRMFTLYVYATERPVVGDTFSIGRAGRRVVFYIKSVDGDETPGKNKPSGVDQNNLIPVQKVVRDGKIFILRGGKTYDLQGNIVK